MAVFVFPGGGGGVQANINRWVSQFKQPDGSFLFHFFEPLTVCPFDNILRSDQIENDLGQSGIPDAFPIRGFFVFINGSP